MDDQLFDQIDKNQDGLLSLEEIQEALSNPDIPEQTIKALFETFDANEDGFISREEAMKKLVQVPAGKEKLVEEFKVLDLNGDGVLTFDEFYEGMKDQMTAEEIESIYRQLDKDNDESITLDEFIMSQIFMCHNNIKTSQENIDRSRACLTEVMRNLTQSDKMETCVNMLQEARKQHLVLTWPSKKRAHKRSPLTEYKNLINSIFEEFSKGSQVLDRLGGVQALAKLGKYVDVADFSKLVAGVGAESDLAVGKEHFLQITFKLLAKEVKSKSQSRLTSLSKPKNKTGELTVEDYLNQVAEENKQRQEGSFSSNAMKVKKKSSLNRNNSIVTSCPIQYEFKRLDVNGDGVLSYDELFEGLKHRMEQDDLAELFDYMDANGDGMVTMEEFCEAKSKIDQNKPKLIF
ncbi:hypothetical protein GUITHDRAFT_116206 [Guillardia theta CCMP2712]|uniref:EF-hand domain-containing protein n=1 Tax=Guillardia theta (strain CCMP2712) TaxID=905079 RepID=L1IMS3_GUITC|nr:hypothetical protein GUITHDRAFT_116206 [Guillardia theta CCMP2712]EKX37566.1 hypothetical protein GUITHDRAFT_116206 [Guillardia theta CCMP2712]|eukprot:XP_005824546.1 hypothetical protein GUITHDRAFT_116206 [Guillardia theta CCMP2712]